MLFFTRILLALIWATSRLAAAVDICSASRTIANSEGEITSPNYPDLYPRNSDCRLSITADSPEATIVIKFDDFNLEEDDDDPDQCLYDKLLIIEAGEEKRRLCGLDKFIRDYTSTSNSLTLHFLSSDSDEYKGFRLTYSIIPGFSLAGSENICPELRVKTKDSLSGSVHSPNFPKPYPNDKNCVALIDVPDDHLTNVWFTSFAIQESPTCRFDKLEIRDRVGGATICGKEKGEVPPPMIMKGKQIHIEFTSNSEIQEDGFLLHYNFTRIQRGRCLCSSGPFYVAVKNFSPKAIRETDDIGFEFRTNQSSGMILYINGYHSDYVHIGLREGNILFCHIDLGTGEGKVEVKIPRLSDGQWHSVQILRDGPQFTLRFDGRIEGRARTRGEFYMLDIPLSTAYFLGVPSDHQHSFPFFTGCIRNLKVDKVEPLPSAVVGKQDYHLSQGGAYREC